MESELEHIRSPIFDKSRFQSQIDKIKAASERAQKKINYISAHNEHIIKAVETVEKFLQKKHRICYGGQAINAYLPAKYKFYDPESSIPDYDFFTPSQMEDITMIVNDLKKEGFTEISAREGMHEGTVKIYVEYIPVADLTLIDPKLYKILSKRATRIDGITYLDSNSLRMLMYLELSRPRGEVERWNKVYERLMIFNEFIPIKKCASSINYQLTKDDSEYILSYIIQNNRVFAGAELISFYDAAVREKKKYSKWLFTSRKPILFFSPNSEMDALKIVEDLQESDSPGKLIIKEYSSKGIDLIPSMKIISRGKSNLVYIIDQSGCHSYFNIRIDNNVMKIASMDTLITLYFSLGLVNHRYLDIGSMECLANKLVEINIKARMNHTKFIFPFISIKCTGHQKTLPSLIRSKVQRLTEKKNKLRNVLGINKRYTINNIKNKYKKQ